MGVTRRWGDFGTYGEGDVASSCGVLLVEGCGELIEGLHGGSFEGGGSEVCVWLISGACRPRMPVQLGASSDLRYC